MCRPKSQGGRRCPSHTDPAKRAEVNRKRREKYAKDKAEKKLSRESKKGLKREEDPFRIPLPHPMFERHPVSRGESHLDPKHRILLTELKGKAFVEENYQSTEVTGVIDPATLDEDSYKIFGFKEIVDGFNESRYVDRIERDALSKEETEVLTFKEKSCLKAYTNADACPVINASVEKEFDDPEITMLGSSTLKQPLDSIYKEATTCIDYNILTRLSPPVVNEIVKNVDSALTQGPGLQRIVYRGIGRVRGQDFRVKEYINETYQIGKTVKFDSYLSTSRNPVIASSFGICGAVFEILTPEGMAIGNLSQHAREEEVLLPRGSRYVIVGRKDNVARKKGGGPITVIQMVAVDENNAILGSDREPRAPEKFELEGETFNEVAEATKKKD